MGTAGKGAKGGMGGGLMGILGGGGGMAKIAGPLAGIAAGIAIIVASSKALQTVLGRFITLFLRLVKPIGDTIAILLQPLIILLTPMVRAFNAMFRPFLRAAQQLMTKGARLMTIPGFEEEGLSIMGTGIMTLMKPFINIFVKGMSEGIILLIDAFSPFIALVLRGLDVLTFQALGLESQFWDIIGSVKDGIRYAVDDWILTSDAAWLAVAEATNIHATNLLLAINDITGGHLADAKGKKDQIMALTAEMDRKAIESILNIQNAGLAYNTAVTGMVNGTNTLVGALEGFAKKAEEVANRLNRQFGGGMSPSEVVQEGNKYARATQEWMRQQEEAANKLARSFNPYGAYATDTYTPKTSTGDVNLASIKLT